MPAAPSSATAPASCCQETCPGPRQVLRTLPGGGCPSRATPGRGREVFRKNCATCHRVADVGVDVGPDIADTRTKTREVLLADILTRTRRSTATTSTTPCATADGTVLQGMIAAETASSLTLRRAEDQTDVGAPQDIEEIRSTGVSLMPEGLEKNITVAEMADLLAFLKNWRYLGGDAEAVVWRVVRSLRERVQFRSRTGDVAGPGAGHDLAAELLGGCGAVRATSSRRGAAPAT